MNDDWRVELDIEGGGHGRRLLTAARDDEKVAKQTRERLGGRVVVTADEDKVFAYAGSREQAIAAADVLREVAQRNGLNARTEVAHWHAEEERWESPDVPLPASADDVEAEQEVREADDVADSHAAGGDEWEVRIELPHRRDAVALAARLQDEGIEVQRRSHFVLIEQPSEAQAEELAERVRGEAPPDATVTVQGSEAMVWGKMHPFWFLGGLGG